ncbi:GNAT family N-acetyltransferase [Streptomyces liangshanensis]|uniref:GNAT family N-acetyltransferase n=1 Tax=Streptomyces liangshanensis TaxID=2717324 RepID=A0A6G9H1M6_9ACTN|nr:GNAT family N-acetyltransferase [Streptomyces liangshanensis]QIQ04433.1 GNAT family N-acetyltransferase [Streptomyces liangshanensis]
MFRIETEVDKERRTELGERLRETNVERSPVMRTLRDSPLGREEPLQVWLLEEATGALAGGLVGRTWARWLHVDLLWVDPGHRGAALGSRLLGEAERVAREERDCARARLETWDFQAPGFYRKQGYEVVGEVTDYPPGVTEYILVKSLSGKGTSQDGREERGAREEQDGRGGLRRRFGR